MYKEFDNRIQGYSVTNMYAEFQNEHSVERWLAYSIKRIITDDFLEVTIQNSKFHVFDTKLLEYEDTTVKFLILVKNMERGKNTYD